MALSKKKKTPSVYEVTVVQYVLLPKRTKPDAIERRYTVNAYSKIQALNAVKNSGVKKSNITNVRKVK